MQEPLGIDKSISFNDFQIAATTLQKDLVSGQELQIETLWIFASALAKHGLTSPASWLDLGHQILTEFGWPNAGIILQGIMESGDPDFFRNAISTLKKKGTPFISEYIGRQLVSELHAQNKITDTIQDLYNQAGRGIEWA